MDTLPTELLDHIISFLPDAHIVKISRLNRYWRGLAVAHLRIYRNCTVYLSQDLGEIKEVEVGVNSDRLHYIRRIVIKPIRNGRLTKKRRFNGNIIQRPLKGVLGLEYFECDLMENEYNQTDLVYIRSMFVHHRTTLKKIVFRTTNNSIFDNFFGFISGHDRRFVYTALNEIEVLGHGYSVGIWWNNCTLSVAPNLQSIRGRSQLAEGGIYIPSVLKCVRDFVTPITVPVDCLSSVIVAMNHLCKLSSIKVGCTKTLSARAHINRVIYNNSSTLEKIRICECHFIEVLRQYDNIIFPRVVDVIYSRHDDRSMSIEDKLLFRRHWCSNEKMPALKTGWVNMKIFANLPVCANNHEVIDQSILNLTIMGYLDARFSMSMLRPVVHRITHLKVGVELFGWEEKMWLSSCFVECQNLKDLSILFHSQCLTPDRRVSALDAFLCGIHHEEVQMIKMQFNHDEMKKYQFAPIRPGLQSSRLENLYLREWDGRKLVRYLSEISCLLVFGRCRTNIFVDFEPLYCGGFDRILEYVQPNFLPEYTFED